MNETISNCCQILTLTQQHLKAVIERLLSAFGRCVILEVIGGVCTGFLALDGEPLNIQSPKRKPIEIDFRWIRNFCHAMFQASSTHSGL